MCFHTCRGKKCRNSRADITKKDHKEFVKHSKLSLKAQKRFKNKRRNTFTEGINKITLSSNNDKRIQSIDSIKKYASGMRKDLVRAKEEIECNNMIKQY